jgi:azurin
MKRALLLLLGAAAIALPSHLFAQASATQKPAAPAPATAKPAAAAAASGRLVEIEANDQMKFSKTTIDAKPGETITVRLKSVGTMPKAVMGHNFILLNASAKPDTFANDAIAAGPAANYIPAARKADMIASSRLIGPGETVDVTFKVPAKAGSYPYLCSFPGHYASGMKGMLVVK